MNGEGALFKNHNSILYSDLNGDGIISLTSSPKEIIEETHYYPFGLAMDGPWMKSSPMKYTYNGTEYEDFLGLDMNLTTYRGLDPALGRWCQIDPKSENLLGMTPYNSMGNNPISNVDPEGDIFVSMLAGAVIGSLQSGAMNMAMNLVSGEKIFKGFGKSLLNGLAGGAVSGGVGSLFTGSLKGQNFAIELLNSSASNAVASVATGQDYSMGNFAGGLAGGAFGSLLPNFRGVKGGWLKNALTEMSFESIRGGLVGGVSGGIGALVDKTDVSEGIKSGINSGVKGGATIAGMRIAFLGATILPEEELDMAVKPTFRRGNIFFGPGAGLTIGRQAAATGYRSDQSPIEVTAAHEAGHWVQQSHQGFAKFYYKTIKSYIKDGFYSSYSKSGTLENAADRFARYYHKHYKF